MGARPGDVARIQSQLTAHSESRASPAAEKADGRKSSWRNEAADVPGITRTKPAGVQLAKETFEAVRMQKRMPAAAEEPAVSPF